MQNNSLSGHFFYQNKFIYQNEQNNIKIFQKDSNINQKKENKQIRTIKLTNKISKQKKSNLFFQQDQKIIGVYKFRSKDYIGSGYSSKVYKAINQKNNHYYAIKTIYLKELKPTHLQMIKSQVKILKKILHPNVIKLQTIQKTKSHLFIVTQYCQKGDLSSYLMKTGKDRLQQYEALQIFSDLVKGLQYLFRVGIIHRDIKLMNILYDGKKWKLADFGFAIQSGQPLYTKTNVGTPLYMPLQVLQSNLYSPQSDIFSLGIVLYELMIGTTPWKCKDQEQLIIKMKNQSIKIPNKLNLSSFSKNLLNKLCSTKRQNRISKKQFLQIDPLIYKQIAQKLININKQTQLKIQNNIKISQDNQNAHLQVFKQYQKSNSSIINTNKILINTNKQIIISKSLSNLDKLNNEDNQQDNLKIEIKKNRKQIIQKNNEKKDKITQQNKQKLLTLLNCSRFMFYLSKNIQYLEISIINKQKIKLILLKNAILIFNQIIDTKNWFRCLLFNKYRESKIYQKLIESTKQYLSKYQKQLQIFQDTIENLILEQLKQKIPQIQIQNFAFLKQQDQAKIYSKISQMIKPIIRQNNHKLAMQIMNNNRKSQLNQKKQIQDTIKSKILGLINLYQYFKFIEKMFKNIVNLQFQIQFQKQITKDYSKNPLASFQLYMQIRKQLKFI